MGSFLGQLFRGPNGNFDFGRLAGLHIVTAFSFVYIYALIRFKSVPSPTDLGSGYALIAGGVVALIAGKDIAVAKANTIMNKGDGQ